MAFIRKYHLWILAGIVLLAAGLRLWGLDTGLPNMSRPDEQNISRPVVQTILQSFFAGEPSLNPRFFIYPSLYMYLLAVAYGIYYLVGHLMGTFTNGADFIRLYLNDWYSFHLISRGITAGMGIVSVWGMYKLALAFFRNRFEALLAAFLMAVTYLHVRDSHFGVTDVPAMLWVMLSLWLAVLFFRTRQNNHLYCSLAMAGLAASTKYPAGLVALAPITVWWQLQQAKGYTPDDCLGRPSLLAQCLKMTGVLFGAFLITSPYVLLDFQHFLADFLEQSSALKQTHYLDLGRAWFHHPRFSFWYGLGSLYFLSGLAGIVLALKNADKRLHAVLLIYGVVYFVLIGNTYVTFARYVIPLIPVVTLYSIYCIRFMARRLHMQNPRLVITPTAAILTFLIGAQSLWLSVQFDRVAAAPDTRNMAREWLMNHIAPDEAVGVGMSLSHIEMPASYKKVYLAPVENPPPPGTRFRSFVPAETAQFGAKPGNSRNEYNITTYSDVNALKKLGIHYVVIGVTPLTLYSTPDFEVEKLEDTRLFKRVATFSPFTKNITDPAIFDQLDGLYIPFSDFTGVKAPGPEVRIYEVL